MGQAADEPGAAHQALIRQIGADAGHLGPEVVGVWWTAGPGRVHAELATRTNATLPRLSHVVRRLEERGLVERAPCPSDGRATDARLTDEGWAKVRATAPGKPSKIAAPIRKWPMLTSTTCGMAAMPITLT